MLVVNRIGNDIRYQLRDVHTTSVCPWAKSTPLSLACERGDRELVDLLFEYGATTSPADQYGGALMRLVCNSESPDTLSIVNTLIKKGANVDGSPGNQESPLVSVCAIGDLPVINRLFVAGARAIPLDGGRQGTPLSH